MAQKRLSMPSVREVLRLKYELGRSHRQIAAALGIGHSTVGAYVRRAEAAGVSWSHAERMDDAALEAAIARPRRPPRVARPAPDWVHIHRALKSHKGTTLQLLWGEYLEQHPDGYQYSRFCDLYRQWCARIDVVLRQRYRGGEKVFVDYAGPRFEVVDQDSGEVREVMVFVGVLAASNYTFVDLTWSRSLPDWVLSHVRMFEFFGGAPELVIPDNEKAAVRKASRYEPRLNRTYQELAAHYGTAVLPARPRRPTDKAKAETGCQIVERQIMAPLRNHTFFSLDELRGEVEPLLEALNEKPFQKLPGSRRSWFEEVDVPALKPLPSERYEYAEWRKSMVNIDYHIQVKHGLYSVPHALARKKVDVRITAHTVEIFFNGKRVAAHRRVWKKHAYSTDPGHMPAAHRAHLEWSPSRLIAWAKKVGPHAHSLVREILEAHKHPEQGYRSCLGIMSLRRSYPDERLDAACRRALRIGSPTYRSLKSILSSGLDKLDDEQLEMPLPRAHAHIRGADYYAHHSSEKED